jgi:hypothetical protein
MGIHIVLNNTANFYNTYVTAVALDAISWKYYLLFVALNLLYGESTGQLKPHFELMMLAAVLWYFFGVETRGRTLEELQSVFAARWPPKASLQKHEMYRAEDGRLDKIQDESRDV